jgi:hypothetical protein
MQHRTQTEHLGRIMCFVSHYGVILIKMWGLRPDKILNLKLGELYEQRAVRRIFFVPIQHMLQKVAVNQLESLLLIHELNSVELELSWVPVILVII